MQEQPVALHAWQLVGLGDRTGDGTSGVKQSPEAAAQVAAIDRAFLFPDEERSPGLESLVLPPPLGSDSDQIQHCPVGAAVRLVTTTRTRADVQAPWT
jgi:hypothetical protein